MARAVRDLGLDAEVYVIGGAARGQLTVLSDVDVLVCLRRPVEPGERARLKALILEVAVERHGLPWDYPVEIHLAWGGGCEKLLSTGPSVRLL